jgi:YegS/Rv2252/BmrU family lipid kinase
MSISKKKILFIINPISGGHHKAKMIRSIFKLLDNNKFDVFITHSKQAGEASKIAQKAVEDHFDILVAVGGDGTINEIASQLVNTNIALAIVPCGSGNGLARDLGISLHYKKAIKQINTLNIKQIDVGVCNQQYFFSLAGIGYDAKVAYDFNRGKKRKFLGYLWAIVKDYFTSTNQHFEMEFENEKIGGKFFFVTVANSSQWGYNVKVAPQAKLDDGILHIVLCKKPSFLSLIPFCVKILSGNATKSSFIDIKTSKSMSLSSHNEFFYHLDGDAKEVAGKVEVNILTKSLNIIAR